MPANLLMPILPTATTPEVRELTRVLNDILRQHTQLLNEITGGKFSQYSAASAAKPVYPGSPGDFIANTTHLVLGAPGSRYITRGWIYRDDGLWHDVNELTDG